MNYFLRCRDFHVNKLKRLSNGYIGRKCCYIVGVWLSRCRRDAQSLKHHLNEINYFHVLIVKKIIVWICEIIIYAFSMGDLDWVSFSSEKLISHILYICHPKLWYQFFNLFGSDCVLWSLSKMGINEET